jgi:hypothetical protein
MFTIEQCEAVCEPIHGNMVPYLSSTDVHIDRRTSIDHILQFRNSIQIGCRGELVTTIFHIPVSCDGRHSILTPPNPSIVELARIAWAVEGTRE